MKAFIIIVVALTVSNAFAQKESETSDRLKVIMSVRSIFEGVDQRDWEKVQRAMAPSVLLDYSSMSGTPAASLTSSEIITSWKSLLPGFDSTRHRLSRFQVIIKDNIARIHYFGKADHYLGGQMWIVEGVYDTVAEKTGENWMITRHKFTLDQQRGDISLPAKAMEIVKQK